MNVAALDIDFYSGTSISKTQTGLIVAEIIDDPDAAVLLENDITDLARRSGEKNILIETPMLLASWRYLFSKSHKPQAILIWEIDKSANGRRLAGLFPIVRNRKRFPLYTIATNFADPMRFLGTPLVDADLAVDVWEVFLKTLRQHVRFPHMFLFNLSHGSGTVRRALKEAATIAGWEIAPLTTYSRATLDASIDIAEVISSSIRKKKIKEYDRLRRRLEETGELRFEVVSDPGSIRQALEDFMAVEASGWKGRSRTNILSASSWTNYFKDFVPELAETGQCEIVRLTLDGQTIASGVMLKSNGLAWFYKTAFDEAYTVYSPGVLLTLDLTRYLCDHPEITMADSCALADHPMIDHIWRQRMEISDLLLIPSSVPFHSMFIKAEQLRLRLRQVLKSVYFSLKKWLKI